MFLNYNKARKYAEQATEIEQAIMKAEKLSEELLDLAEIDADAFEPVLGLFKLPKDTEEERQTRRKKIDQGLANAAKPPFEIMKNG